MTRVVAELSANHQGSLERALALVDAAKAAGAWAVKLQTWDPDAMVLDHEYMLRSGPWAGRRLVDLYREAATPYEWHAPIFQRARAAGLVAFSSVFDRKSLQFLERLECPAYKIASFEAVDLPLIHEVASTGKPVVISTGMASMAEVEEAYEAARRAGCRDIILLKCTSAYPAEPADVHLRTMLHMRDRHGPMSRKVGLSDHTRGLAAAVAAAALGATMIEKHLTLARADGGLDADFSTEPEEFARLCQEVAAASKMMGEVLYGPRPSEMPQYELRRSLYFAKDLEAGAPITHDAVRSARPGKGLAPGFYGRVRAMRTSAAVRRGDPVRWEVLTEGEA